MNKIIASIIVALACITPVRAQNKTTLLQRMNEIKSQNDIYFWGQYTHPNADTAKIGATKRLLLEVNLNRSDEAQVMVDEIIPHASYINIDRGNLKQIFVYIKKTDAIAIGSKKSNTEPAIISNSKIAVYEQPATSPVRRTFVPDAFVQRVMETKDFINVYKLLKSLQAQGQILQFGKLKDVGDYNSLDLILFDMQSQQVITMLSPVTASGQRTNVVDGTDDSLDNYPTNMTAVIWYIKK